MTTFQFVELDHHAKRQLINSETTFLELQRTRRERAQYRITLEWAEIGGVEHLLNTSAAAHKDLGARSQSTEAIFDKAIGTQSSLDARIESLTSSLEMHQRLNAALRVGRCNPTVVNVLHVLEVEGLGDQFLTVGTHALYAYESAAGVRFAEAAMETQDIDLLVNMEGRLQIATALKERSFLSLLQKADPTFKVREGNRETAVNAQGFEVDVIQRITRGDDPHPWRMSDHEDDLWPVRVGTGQKLGSVKRYSQMVVDSDGAMAMMNTIDPHAFVAIKKNLASMVSRDPRKATKDSLQAEIVQALIDKYRIEVASRPIVPDAEPAADAPEPPAGSLRRVFSPK